MAITDSDDKAMLQEGARRYTNAIYERQEATIAELRAEVERYEKTYGKSDYGTLLAERDAAIALLKDYIVVFDTDEPPNRYCAAVRAFLKETQ